MPTPLPSVVDAPVVRTTVNLPQAQLSALEALALAKGITVSQALRNAVETDTWLRQAQAEGSILLLYDKSGRLQKICLA